MIKRSLFSAKYEIMGQFNNLTVLIFMLFCSVASSQSVAALLDMYSAKEGVEWDPHRQTITFLKSGTIQSTQNSWRIPHTVKQVIIAENVTLIGRFDCSSDLVIEGQDRDNSILFGTDEPKYAKRNGGGDKLSAVRVTKGRVRLQNLTSLNPKGFHFTSRDGSGFFEISNCNLYDRRGGQQNNSDGIVTWGGGKVSNCYIASGDDAIKVYGSITVEDTHIEMIPNAVPIQLGWGNYGNGAVGIFKNIKISGTEGRYGAGRPIISARRGKYQKKILIDGITIDNPHASLLSFREGHGDFQISINRANIRVARFQHDWNAEVQANIKICGVEYDENTELNQWNCAK